MLFSTISIFIFVSFIGAVHNTPCVGTYISCQTFSSTGTISCSIFAQNGTIASSLVNECTQQPNPGIQSHVYTLSGFNNDMIALDIGPGVIVLSLIINGIDNEITFTSSQPNITRVSITSRGSVNLSQTILNSFPNLELFDISFIRMDGFPLFYSDLKYLRMDSLMLPSVVTIQSSNLDLPGLIELSLLQATGDEWFRLASDSFDNAPNILLLIISGLRHFSGNQFVKLTNLIDLFLTVDSPNTTFDANAFVGLNTITSMRLTDAPNIDFILSNTFPALENIQLRNDKLISLNQEFFQRQKSLSLITAYDNPFNCSCDMAWVSHVTDKFGLEVFGTCSNGNLITNSSNYVNCPISSYLCFNATFLCPSDSTCVNTVDNAYCGCNSGLQVQPGDICSGGEKLIHQSTMSILLLMVLLL